MSRAAMVAPTSPKGRSAPLGKDDDTASAPERKSWKDVLNSKAPVNAALHLAGVALRESNGKKSPLEGATSPSPGPRPLLEQEVNSKAVNEAMAQMNLLGSRQAHAAQNGARQLPPAPGGGMHPGVLHQHPPPHGIMAGGTAPRMDPALMPLGPNMVGRQGMQAPDARGVAFPDGGGMGMGLPPMGDGAVPSANIAGVNTSELAVRPPPLDISEGQQGAGALPLNAGAAEFSPTGPGMMPQGGAGGQPGGAGPPGGGMPPDLGGGFPFPQGPRGMIPPNMLGHLEMVQYFAHMQARGVPPFFSGPGFPPGRPGPGSERGEPGADAAMMGAPPGGGIGGEMARGMPGGAAAGAGREMPAVPQHLQMYYGLMPFMPGQGMYPPSGGFMPPPGMGQPDFFRGGLPPHMVDGPMRGMVGGMGGHKGSWMPGGGHPNGGKANGRRGGERARGHGARGHGGAGDLGYLHRGESSEGAADGPRGGPGGDGRGGGGRGGDDGPADELFALNVERVERGEDERTTVMVKNIPNKYTQRNLLELIDVNHLGTYDFFYLPIDFKNKCNLGYAFINFREPQRIAPFFREFADKRWERFNSEKVCVVRYARIQGISALVNHFRSSRLMLKHDKYRPLLFSESGNPETIPPLVRGESAGAAEGAGRGGAAAGGAEAGALVEEDMDVGTCPPTGVASEGGG
jgi:hypothetical protein